MAKKTAPQVHPDDVTLNLEASLAARRKRAPAAWESAQGLHKRRFTRALEEIEAAAAIIAQDVAGVLAEHVDELSTSQHEFRTGMLRVFKRVLRVSRERVEQVVIFNEAVPGFTLLLFKKDMSNTAWQKTQEQEDIAVEEAQTGPELAAAGRVISQFVQRTGNRVLTVETDDALFVFFPASDVKKNLKEMGFYFTD